MVNRNGAPTGSHQAMHSLGLFYATPRRSEPTNPLSEQPPVRVEQPGMSSLNLLVDKPRPILMPGFQRGISMARVRGTKGKRGISGVRWGDVPAWLRRRQGSVCVRTFWMVAVGITLRRMVMCSRSRVPRPSVAVGKKTGFACGRDDEDQQRHCSFSLTLHTHTHTHTHTHAHCF